MHPTVLLAALSVLRQVIYPGADFGSGPIPKFERGYLLFLKRPCELTVYKPSGELQFGKKLQAPGAALCFPADASIAADGRIAVAIGYSGPRGYAGGILLLDAAGAQISFIETGRYMPSHIGFGPEGSLWSAGWQRDEFLNDTADKNDYAIVRRYSRSGAETGAFIPRSLWKTTGEPVGTSLGYWQIAFGKDRIGVFAYENFSERTTEWVEWDYNGKLLSRTAVGDKIHGGRAYTASGQLYGGIWNEAKKAMVLSVLDRETGVWKPVADAQYVGQWKLLLGADGDDLVFKSTYGGTQLTWMRVP